MADAVSSLGTFVATLGVQFVMIDQLGSNQAEIGVVRTAQWLPMLLFGLLSGVLLDRIRRRPVLIASDTAAAVALGTIAALALTGTLTLSLLMVLVFILGASSVFFRAGHQSYLPSLVPVRLLPTANARIEQTMTAAESIGPLAAGALFRVTSAPVAIAVDAVTRLISAILISRIKEPEPEPEKAANRSILRELIEGARWVYAHRTLAPYAVSLHVWFFFHSLITTLYVFYASQELGLDALWVGVTLACAGVTGVLGAGLAPRAGQRFGVGRVYVLSMWLCPMAYLGIVLAPAGQWGIVVLCASYALNGLSMGLQDPLSLSYRNAVTPSAMRGRMNATIRSFNWSMLAIAGPVAGFVALSIGNRPTLGIGVAGVALAALLVAVSPFRDAKMPADPDHGAAADG